VVIDLDDAIHHQHVGGGQLAVTLTKQFPTAAGEQLFTGKGLFALFAQGEAGSSGVVV